MRVGITINNVLRDHIPQVTRAYNEITGLEPIEPINPFDIEASFPKIEGSIGISEFTVTGDTNVDFSYNESADAEPFDVMDLMYNSGSFEIFGRAIETNPGNIHKLKDIEKKSKIEFVLLNKESPRSKCATLFFLSKINFDFNEILFPLKDKDFWNDVDVLITDNPKILKTKPKGKIAIKVENQFNVDIKSDYSIVSISDHKQLKKIIKSIKKP